MIGCRSPASSSFVLAAQAAPGAPAGPLQRGQSRPCTSPGKDTKN